MTATAPAPARATPPARRVPPLIGAAAANPMPILHAPLSVFGEQRGGAGKAVWQGGLTEWDWGGKPICSETSMPVFRFGYNLQGEHKCTKCKPQKHTFP